MTDYNRETTATSMGNSSSSTGTFGSGGTGTMSSTGNMGSTATTGASGARRWDDYRDTYRSDWENRYGQNQPWNEHEEAYRYGWHAGQHERWRGRNWDDASSDLEQNWSNRHQYFDDDDSSGRDSSTGSGTSIGDKVGNAWESFKDTVREGFDRARGDFGDDRGDDNRSDYNRS
jgi:hypothetical protein